MKPLKLNKKIVACEVNKGDEIYQNGIFQFNITKLIEHINKHPDKFSVEEVAISDINTVSSSINEAHVDSRDIILPVILAEIYPGLFNLIDGNHRVEKAKRIGTDNVPAYKWRIPEHLPFLIYQEAYESFVEYWNGKVKALSKYSIKK